MSNVHFLVVGNRVIDDTLSCETSGTQQQLEALSVFHAFTPQYAYVAAVSRKSSMRDKTMLIG